MIKVCHITSVHPPTDIRILHKEAVSLASAGYDVFLLAPGTKDMEQDGVKVKAVIPPNYSRLKRMILGGYLMYKECMRMDADIYHFHDPELMVYAIILATRGKKVVFDAHEDLPLQILGKYYIPRIIRSPLALLTGCVLAWGSRYLSAIVTATGAIARRFQGHARQVVVVRNLPLLSEFPEPEPKRDTKNQVCYLGGIFKMRGIVELMQSLPLAGVRLALAGTYTPLSLRDELLAMPQWEYVDEKGMLNRPEVAILLTQSLAGMVTLLPAPNFLESLPVKMFEYMAAGIPVIASNFPLWKQIIEESQCGICVDPSDYKAIAAAIRYLIENPEEAKRMGQNGRDLVQHQLNWHIESQKLLDLYDSLKPQTQCGSLA